MDWLFHTDNSFSYVVLRAGLAVTFFMHGTQHAFGWNGGKGAKAQVTNWRDKYHIPLPMGIFALVIELFAVVSMTLGFLVRPAAFGLAVFISFALFLSHWSNGFFLASGPGKGSGIE
ncbi:MAG TPA: DoxX family protein, partial [Candidatus Saccharimonadales bacterium]|nr:DoxX family protein [Candidatus Saccharimonadales bacterium]